MYYFTAPIPRHEDGTIAKYPPNWFGVMAQCPKDVTVLIFNDQEGWLLAQCDDTFVPKEVKVVSEAEVKDWMSKTPQASNVFVGVQAIEARWAKQQAEDTTYRQKLFADAIKAVVDG